MLTILAAALFILTLVLPLLVIAGAAMFIVRSVRANPYPETTDTSDVEGAA